MPVWVGRKMVGVVRHEQVGAKRTWTQDDETFAYLMSHFVALALERRDRDPRSSREEPPSSIRLTSLNGAARNE